MVDTLAHGELVAGQYRVERVPGQGGTGVLIGDALWSVAVPTDPGTYTVTASAPGRVWS